MSRNKAAIGVLLAAVFIVFRAVPGHDFINFDDNSYVSENHYVRNGLTAESFRAAFTETFNGHWHPFTMLSYMLDTTVFGPGPGGYHFTNLLLHAANTLVLLFLLHNITGAFWPSYLVASLFALHPAHVEPVAWIASRKDLLSTLFFLLTMQAHAAYARNPKRATYAIASVCLVLGLLSKAMLVTVPAVLLLMDYWPLRRIDFASEVRWRTAAKLVSEKWLYFVIAIAFSSVTVFTQSHAGTMTSFEDLPLSARLFNAMRAYGDYLRIAVWPAGLAPFYPHSGRVESLMTILPAISTLALITAVSILLARRAPFLIVGWLFFLGTLLPVSGLMQAGIQSYADRYTYVPFIGLFIIGAWGARDVAYRWKFGARVVTSASAAVLVLCAVLSDQQTNYWKDDIALFEHTLGVTEKNHVAHMILGNAYSKTGRIDEAIVQFRAGIAIGPLDADLHTGLAIALGVTSNLPASRKEYLEALRINPGHVIANTNVGALLDMQGDHTEAVS
ncbi:MAG: tetratricopeptide repeat protein, partial [Candidatus Hydrogenedentota bacterium]